MPACRRWAAIINSANVPATAIRTIRPMTREGRDVSTVAQRYRIAACGVRRRPARRADRRGLRHPGEFPVHRRRVRRSLSRHAAAGRRTTRRESFSTSNGPKSGSNGSSMTGAACSMLACISRISTVTRITLRFASALTSRSSTGFTFRLRHVRSFTPIPTARRALDKCVA